MLWCESSVKSKSCLAQFHAARNWRRCWRSIERSGIWIWNTAESVWKASRPNGLIFFLVVLERLFEPASKTVDVLCRCGRWCLNTFNRVWRVGRIHFAPRDCSTRNVFLEPWMYSKYFEISFLNSLFYSLHQDSTLNAFYGGQALATALKLNDTVVDINLARSYECGNEGAEACEPIWDELTAGGLDLPDIDWHWPCRTFQTLSGWMLLLLFSSLRCFHFDWMYAIFLAGNGGRPQHEHSHPAFELGDMWNRWCWGGGQTVVMRLYFAAAKGSRAEGCRGWT